MTDAVIANTAQPARALNHDGFHSNESRVERQNQSAANTGIAVAAK